METSLPTWNRQGPQYHSLWGRFLPWVPPPFVVRCPSHSFTDEHLPHATHHVRGWGCEQACSWPAAMMAIPVLSRPVRARKTALLCRGPRRRGRGDPRAGAFSTEILQRQKSGKVPGSTEQWEAEPELASQPSLPISTLGCDS